MGYAYKKMFSKKNLPVSNLTKECQGFFLNTQYTILLPYHFVTSDPFNFCSLPRVTILTLVHCNLCTLENLSQLFEVIIYIYICLISILIAEHEPTIFSPSSIEIVYSNCNNLCTIINFYSIIRVRSVVS